MGSLRVGEGMDEATRSALITSLDEAGRLQESHAREIDVALVEIGREEGYARKAMEEAQRRLLALAELRAEYEERQSCLQAGGLDRERRAVAEGLARDRATLELRAGAAAGALEARLEEARQRVESDGELAGALTEVLRYREMEPGLDRMPPSYRQALQDRFARATRRLAPVAQLVGGPGPRLDLPTAGVGVVLAVDPPEGRPQAMVVVLPIPFDVYEAWTGRGDDLCARLAWRTVAGVHHLLAALHAADAPVRYLEVHGCVAIQVWLGETDVGADLADRAVEALASAWDRAAELDSAGLEVYTVHLRPELLAEREDA